MFGKIWSSFSIFSKKVKSIDSFLFKLLINFQNLERCLSILSFANSVVVPALNIKLQSDDSERRSSLAACLKILFESSSSIFLEFTSTKVDPAFVISETTQAFVSLIQ